MRFIRARPRGGRFGSGRAAAAAVVPGVQVLVVATYHEREQRITRGGDGWGGGGPSCGGGGGPAGRAPRGVLRHLISCEGMAEWQRRRGAREGRVRRVVSLNAFGVPHALFQPRVPLTAPLDSSSARF